MEAIRLIDYEYAGLNAVAYDVANHWCEYAADYGTATPHVLDYGRLPGPEERVGACIQVLGYDVTLER